MIYYLASIPRSGSTLLASLLEQRPDTYVSPTSNLGDMMGSLVAGFENAPATEAGECGLEELYRSLKGVVDGKYSERSESIIFDKGRTWPSPIVMETMTKVMGETPKIIATVRPITECIADFYKIDNKDIDIREWVKSSHLMNHLLEAYDFLKTGYEKHPERFCLIEYSDLCDEPQRELDRISDFIGVEKFTYNPHIEQVEENDNAWDIPDLHKLNSRIEKTGQDTRQVLGEKLYNYYLGGEFWNDNPDPVKEKLPIDFSLEAALRGEHSKSYKILKELEKNDPSDNRVAFNLGWHEMSRGNLLAGHKLLDRGRYENVFGNPNISSGAPIWKGERNVSVLLNLEGGLGDQIHTVKYAKNIAEYGNKVIVSGSPELGAILKDCEGVSAYAQSDAAGGVYHDYWLPSMSSAVPLNLEYKDLSGKAYIERSCPSEGKIGVKWLGNPEFEHEQHREFPKELLFNTITNVEGVISLQKEGEKPEWMGETTLDTWEDTKYEISRCDLVISSCTSVAHLSAAMGIETWIVVPILPYYLWALPGDTTQHYDSVKLFRQTEYGCWKKPFQDIKQELLRRKISKFTYGESTKSFIEA